MEDVFVKCIAGGYFGLVRYMVEKKQVRADCQESIGLVIAAKEGRAKTVRYLIKKGADVHVNNEEPLVIACENERWDTAKALVENGANMFIAYKFLITDGQTEKANSLLSMFNNT